MPERKINLSDDFPELTFTAWKEKVIKDLKGKSFEKLFTKTFEDITLQPLYDFHQSRGTLEKSPYPSQVNYRRGFSPSGYSLRKWQIAQNLYETVPEKFNIIAKHELEQRQNAISARINGINKKLILDKLSLRINNYDDFKNAFSGIDFTKVPVHFSLTSDYLRFFNFLQKFSNEQKLEMENFKGSAAADPIRTFAASGKIPKLNLNDDSLKFYEYVKSMSELFPPVRTIGIDASIYSDAGATAVQELAFSLAAGVEYFNFLNEKLSNNLIAKKTRFTFGIGTNFFMEIAKLRAFRVLWDSVLTGFGVNVNLNRILVEVRSSQFTQTITEPYSNLLRATTEALAGIIGGVDLIDIAPYNIGFEKPSAFSRRIAANIQIIIREETNIGKVIDSAGGSYYVENLTNELVNKAWELFQTIEKNGGMIEALRKAIPQKMVNKIREEKINYLKMRKSSLIGTNVYVKNSGEIPVEISSPAKHNAAFTDSWEEVEKFDFSRASMIFEDLLKSVNKYAEENKGFPQITGLAIGEIPDYKPRADFSRSLFETAAFEINFNAVDKINFDIEQILKNSDSRIILLASSDQKYLEFIEELKSLISDNPDRTFIIAGKHPEIEAVLQNFENVDFIFASMNVYDFLKNLFENKILSVKNV